MLFLLRFVQRVKRNVLGLSICGFDCLLSAEWKSPNKILAISGPIKGKGEIIVTTRLGGVGTCNVTFKGYHETIGPMKESAVWVEETTPLFVWGRHSLSPSSYQQEDPLGLSVEGNDKKFPEDDLTAFFPDKCGDIAANQFSAGWFLLENHHATSFNDLQAGYVNDYCAFFFCVCGSASLLVLHVFGPWSGFVISSFDDIEGLCC